MSIGALEKNRLHCTKKTIAMRDPSPKCRCNTMLHLIEKHQIRTSSRLPCSHHYESTNARSLTSPVVGLHLALVASGKHRTLGPHHAHLNLHITDPFLKLSSGWWAKFPCLLNLYQIAESFPHVDLISLLHPCSKSPLPSQRVEEVASAIFRRCTAPDSPTKLDNPS